MHEATGIRPLYIALVVATTSVASARLWSILRVDGITPLEFALWAVFTILFAWISVGFWLVCLGAFARCRGPGPASSPLLQAERPTVATRAAIVMPVFNESVGRVFAGIRAMLESIQGAGGGERFDFFLLSDSTKPDCRLAEELAFRRLRDETDQGLFYRHRAYNKGRKPGNVADFCANWGDLYDYMVVLDADSLMTGETLLAMTEMMDANPKTALIQAPPALIGGSSLFSVILQFASRVYGPLHAAGLAMLQGSGGNYWGHNAIIRVRAFVENCGLPQLPGKAPLGGDILSHDFVEAALLHKAGWQLWLAPGLGGSFEETPSGVIDYLARDRRWCQGNMQHIRLLLAQGFRPSSRIHLAFGIMSYLSSPLWLLLLVLTGIEADQLRVPPTVFYIGRYPILNVPVPHTTEFIMLVFAAVVLLFGPKFIALFSVLGDPGARRGFGGARRLAVGVLLESLFSVLYAPIAALTHSWFVLNIFLGRSISWTPPRRGDSRTSFFTVTRFFAPHMAIAALVGAIAWHWLPNEFWWLLPLLVGPFLSIFLVKFLSEPGIGNRLYRAGNFVIPRQGLEIVSRVDELIESRDCDDMFEPASREDLVRRNLGDPLVHGLRSALGDIFAVA